MSIFDKIKEFFGILMLGLIVNNLPAIIGRIKKFFDDNKWLVEGFKFVLKGITYGIGGLINLVGMFNKSKQDKVAKETKELEKSFKKLDGELDTSQKDVDKELKNFEQKNKEQKESQDRNAERIAARQQSRSSTSSPGSINPESTNPAPQSSRVAPPPKPEQPQKFAMGGKVPASTVKPADRKVESKTTAPTSAKTTSSTTQSKKAKRFVNSFQFFDNNVTDSKDTAEKETKNNDMFKEILVSLREIQKIRSLIKDEDGDGGEDGGGGGGGGGGEMLPGDAPPEVKAMLEAISGGEGSWDSVNPNTTVPGLSNMTIADARRAAIQKGINQLGGSGAMGKWQQMPDYVLSRARSAGLNPDRDTFSPENQTKIARMLMASVYPGGESRLVQDAKQDPMKAAAKLRGTWPSLPGGSQQNTTEAQFRERFASSVQKYREPSATPTQGSLSAVLPRGNAQFTSGFRSSRRPDHNGIDIGVDANSPVTALQDGTVVDIYRNFGDWGDAVVVQHSDGTKLIYGHVISSVRKNSSVRKGQVIAKVKYWPGGRGYSDNTHLHLERVVGGRYVDPSGYLNSVYQQRQRQQQVSSNPRQNPNLASSGQSSGTQQIAIVPIVNNRTQMIPVPYPVQTA
jgi:murein DD-endopeptidase MepM/ murein hydrolase activator NlpD